MKLARRTEDRELIARRKQLAILRLMELAEAGESPSPNEELQVELSTARRIAAEAFARQLEGDRDQRTLEVSQLLDEHGADFVREVGEALAQSFAAERVLAVAVLRQVHEVDPEVGLAEFIGHMLDDETEPAVRASVVAAIGWTRQPSLLDRVLKCVRDPSALVRDAAAGALSRFAPDERAARGIRDLAQDHDDDVRWSAVFELAAWIQEIDDAAISSQLRSISLSDPSPEIREAAARGLQSAGNARAR